MKKKKTPKKQTQRRIVSIVLQPFFKFLMNNLKTEMQFIWNH